MTVSAVDSEVAGTLVLGPTRRFIFSIFITKLVRESQDPADRWAYGENFELLTNTMVAGEHPSTSVSVLQNARLQ